MGLATWPKNYAFSDCKTAYLAGIVTGTPSKEAIWSEKYGIPKKNIYNYENFDNIDTESISESVFRLLIDKGLFDSTHETYLYGLIKELKRRTNKIKN